MRPLIPLSHLLPLLLMVMLFTPSARAAEDYAEMAAQIARLRGEVESLSTGVESLKEDIRSRSRLVSEQRSDLEIQIQREQLRFDQVAKSRDELKAGIEHKDAEAGAYKPLVAATVERLKKLVADGLPFKQAERTAELDRIMEKAESGALSPAEALSQLWAFSEDEYRLGHENGLFSQVIPASGGEKLVEVARLGMVMMYYRDDQGQAGYARRTESGWDFPVLADKAAQEQVALLFEDLRKQIRSGYFVLPNALPQGGQ